MSVCCTVILFCIVEFLDTSNGWCVHLSKENSRFFWCCGTLHGSDDNTEGVLAHTNHLLNVMQVVMIAFQNNCRPPPKTKRKPLTDQRDTSPTVWDFLLEYFVQGYFYNTRTNPLSQTFVMDCLSEDCFQRNDCNNEPYLGMKSECQNRKIVKRQRKLVLVFSWKTDSLYRICYFYEYLFRKGIGVIAQTYPQLIVVDVSLTAISELLDELENSFDRLPRRV